MKDLFKRYIIPALVALVVTVLFILLRTSPAYKLWKGYTVLSVPLEADKKIVGNVLLETECGEVISLEAQRSEDFSMFTPFFSLDEVDTYNQSKTLYFFDRDKRVSLYYIPDVNKKQAQTAAGILNQEYKISATLDSHNSFPWLVPIVALVVFIVFIYFSENKLVFILSGIFPLAFCFCNPHYAVAASACLELYAFYLAQKVWRRRGGTRFVLTNPYILLFSFIAIVGAFTLGFVPGVLYILNFFAAISMLFILLNLQEEYEKRFRFIPVLIRNAKMAGAMTPKSVNTMLVCSLGVFLLLILFLTGVNFSSGNGEKDLYFPAPKEYNISSNEFPSLDDYFARKWNSIAVQYRSLNSANGGVSNSAAVYPAEGETVSQIHYEKDGSEIKAVEQVLYTYNESFRKDAVASLLALDYPAIEKLWIEQGRKFSTVYTAEGNAVESGRFSIVVLLFGMFMPLGAAFNYIFMWRKKRNVF